jgi:hypothetical protein
LSKTVKMNFLEWKERCNIVRVCEQLVHNHIHFIMLILSRVGVTYKTGFGLDDWIYCILYIHTVRDYRQLQRYRCSTHYTIHRCTRNRFLRLH